MARAARRRFICITDAEHLLCIFGRRELAGGGAFMLPEVEHFEVSFAPDGVETDKAGFLTLKEKTVHAGLAHLFQLQRIQ